MIKDVDLMNTSDLQARLCDELTDEQLSRIFPIIEQGIIDAKSSVKQEAIRLVKGFFPDPHEPGHDCTDCLLIDSVAETLDVYVSVKAYNEDAE